MALEEYEHKRELDRTPEPVGGEPTSGLPTFVVQLHRASRLHYDFRLEAQGVLKSWAVPKGPSMNPGDKRLAMMVEDHPMDYRTFEGIIPRGNYGAGTVMVWDEGTYAAPGASTREDVERAVKLGLHKGHVAFFLAGSKLRGLFDLVQLKGREEHAWLITKRNDEFATPDSGLERDRSVLTSRTLEEIRDGAASSGQVWYSDRMVEKIDLAGAPESPMPRPVRPMLATETNVPFDRKGWLFEVKWDGYRAIAEIEQEGEVRLYSRNGLSFNQRYPAILKGLHQLKHAAVLDGEVVTVDGEGHSRFQWLQEYQKSHRGTLLYYVFDLLYLDGHDLRMLQLRRRKEILRQILPDEGLVRLSDHVEDHGCSLFDAISAQELEGMMAKNGDSLYEEGRRGPDWLKIKRLLCQEAVIGGYTQGRNSRRHFGALVLGVYDGHDLIYVGHTGGGFDEEMLATVSQELEPLRREDCPFKDRPKTNMPVVWVAPSLVCDITFRGWTESGHLRQPVFSGLRKDLDPRSVRRGITVKELPAPTRFRQKDRDQMIEVAGRTLKATNLNKVFWPEEGYTKQNLIDYYREVAQFILPYLKDRPESLHRHPNGVEQKGFFQKDMPPQTPPWIETVDVFSPSQGKMIHYLLCQDEATLVYMANLACIEVNPWNSSLSHLDRPDYTVIDLDPFEIEFRHVVETALAVRGLLEEIEVPGYCKTSGSRGLHIYIPLGARYDYAQGRQFTELVARLVHARLPHTTSLERMPSNRRGKVYLDFLQNRDGQTLAAPYSARPKPGATVSTPLSWDEVGESLDPRSFTMRTILDRLEKVGDLWAPVVGPGIDMAQALDRVQGTFAGDGT